MAEAVRIRERATLARCSGKRRVHCDANNVCPWWNRHLPISPVQNEILTTELPNVSICPAKADALISDNSWFCRRGGCTTRQIVAIVICRAREGLIFLDINHAKATLGRAPDEAGCRINQLVESVVTKMKVPGAGFQRVRPSSARAAFDRQSGQADLRLR